MTLTILVYLVALAAIAIPVIWIRRSRCASRAGSRG